MSYCFFSLYWKLLLVVHGTSFLQDCSSGMGHYFFAAILFTVDICHPLHLKRSVLCTVRLLALITVTSVCHIWSPGGAEDPEAVSIHYVSIPSVGRRKLSLPLRWGSSWLGSPLVSMVTLRLRTWRVSKCPSLMYRLWGKLAFPSLASLLRRKREWG